MQSVYGAMRAFFEQDEWSFTPMDDQPVLRMGFQGDNGAFSCFAQAIEERGQFVFYSFAPFLVPEAQRLAVVEYITRANYGLFVGNFEMDLSDGEVRFKTSADVVGTDMPPKLFTTNVVQNVLLMDRYLGGLQAVSEGKLSPVEAIEQVEGGDE
jgi:hypothetical protein